MRLQVENGQVVFTVEPSDTTESVARLVDLLSGATSTQQVADDGTAYAIQITPNDGRLPFVVAVPKYADSDATLLTLCAAYLNQQDTLG